MTTLIVHAESLRRARNIAWIVATLGMIAGAIGWLLSPEAFYRAYLHGWLLWLGVSLGSLGITTVIHLLNGNWGLPIRRLAEISAMLLPLLAILFIPIAFGVRHGTLFPWAHVLTAQDDPVLVHRQPYLNVSFFLVRSAIYAVCWIGSAWLLWSGSHQITPVGVRRLYALSGPCLLLYLLTMGLFASTDWILSLEPHYKSTIFGLIIVVGQGVSALCVLIASLYLLTRNNVPANTVGRDVWNDLANVLLTATMLWCYLESCQFIINWMGNTQDENRWYLQRLSNGWLILSGLIVVFHLLLPLGMLLIRRVKRSPSALFALSVVLLVTRGVDGFWMINASGADPSPMLSARFSWLDVVLPLAVGGIWVCGFIALLSRVPPVAEEAVLPAGAAYG